MSVQNLICLIGVQQIIIECVLLETNAKVHITLSSCVFEAVSATSDFKGLMAVNYAGNQ